MLTYLVQNPGRLIPKAELIDHVWKDVAVTENSLVQCIKDIRQVLQDEAQTDIQTVSKRGYLFTPSVVGIEERDLNSFAVLAGFHRPENASPLPAGLPSRCCRSTI